MNIFCLDYILVETAQDKMRMRVWRVHSSHLPYSQPVLVSSRSSRIHVGKSVPSQRKRECLKCLAWLTMILTRECECLHLCVLCLVHISPKVSTSTQHENVNQALELWESEDFKPKSILHKKIAENYIPYRKLGQGISLISPRSETRRFQKLPFLIYYNVLELESRFTLRMNAAKNIDTIKKWFKQLFRIKFPTKTRWTHISISARSGARGLQRLLFLKILWCTGMGK